MRYTAMNAAERENFHRGFSDSAYQMFGAHPVEQDGRAMWHFCVWAPNAQRVCLVGDFNGWDREATPLAKQFDGTWEIRLPAETFGDGGIGDNAPAAGSLYKFAVYGADGQWQFKADPYAFYTQMRPDNASRLYSLEGYEWGDEAWLRCRAAWDSHRSPMNIYEVHLGSWKRIGSQKSGDGHAGSVSGSGDAGRFMSYLETADELIPYVKGMGYTHLELMPVMEHPLDMSWGYQVSGFFSATSRYGQPKDLMAFIDRCHREGLGVILDWVPAHFPKDEVGLRRFDGTCCYEHPDARRGEMPQWGTCMFDLAKGEVQSFLMSSAFFWLKYFHADGLRVDAVSSMLYHDFCRGEGQWLPNIHGGRENLEGIDFLQRLNTRVAAAFPGAMMIAEESSAFPRVTGKVEDGGLAFNYKWNMGWMNDILSYCKKDPVYRKWHHDKLTFSLMYAFHEYFILPFSHDEVVHGKGSMLDKQPGDIWKKFAGLRALYGYTIGHPGKKLLFMGGEFGQFIEWRFDDQLDWFLLLYDMHPQLQRCVRDLNHLYLDTPALYQVDDGWNGFQWAEADEKDLSIAAFLRMDKHGKTVLFVTNFTPEYRPAWRVGLPTGGTMTEIFNTDSTEYGGSGQHNPAPVKIESKPHRQHPYSAEIAVPPLSTVIYRVDKKPGRKKTLKPETITSSSQSK